MHVPVSEKNPAGITIRDRHVRHLKGTYLDATEIESIFKNYDAREFPKNFLQCNSVFNKLS